MNKKALIRNFGLRCDAGLCKALDHATLDELATLERRLGSWDTCNCDEVGRAEDDISAYEEYLKGRYL